MRTFLTTALLAASLAAAPARAANPTPGVGQDPARAGGGELSGWLVLGASYGYGYHEGYDNGVGVGGRYRLSLVPQGILRPTASQLRDSIDLEFGADLVRYGYHYADPNYHYDYAFWAVRPRVGVMWNFWLTPTFALYPKLDLGYQLGWYNGWDPAVGPQPSWNGLFLEGSIGMIWRFRRATSLRVELGSEGVKLGLGIAY